MVKSDLRIHNAARRSQTAAVGPHTRLQLTRLVITLLAVLSCAVAVAKEKRPPSKTVSGVVFDGANNALDGATVELTDLQTGKVLDIYSQEGGQYQFADLSLDHDYKIKAMYKGKSSEERQISSLDTRTRPVMNLTVPVSKP